MPPLLRVQSVDTESSESDNNRNLRFGVRRRPELSAMGVSEEFGRGGKAGACASRPGQKAVPGVTGEQ